MHDEHELLTATEVAEIVGRDRRTVQRWIDLGTLPIVRKLPGANGPYIIRRADLNAFLDQRRAS